MHKWANPTLTCTSCHVYRGDKCDAWCTSKTSSFHNSAAAMWSFGTLVNNREHQRRPAEAHQEIFAAPACPAGICHDEGRPLFGWVPSPPKNVGSSGKQMSWHRVESAIFLRHGESKRRRGLPSTRACSSWKWNSSAAAPGAAEGAREYRRLRAFPIWGIHIQTKSTFICGINGIPPPPTHVDAHSYLAALEDVITPYLTFNLCLLGDFNAMERWTAKRLGRS